MPRLGSATAAAAPDAGPPPLLARRPRRPEIWDYVAARNRPAADRLADLLEQASLRLAASPGIGRPRPELGSGIRSLPVRRYLILYREIAGGILVLRYVHGARDLPALPLEPPKG